MGRLRLPYLAVALAGLSQMAITTAQAVPAPASTHPGTTTSCTRWHVIQTGNTCPGIYAEYGITSAQFLAWNPAVSNDCVTNFWVGFAYCVSITPGVPPAPTLSGTIATCKRWHVVQSGNTCEGLETQYGITRTQFLAWNPAVSSNCATNFWAGYAYCVGLTPAPSSTSSSSTSSSSSSSSSSTSLTATPVTTGAPGPTMTDIPNNCNGWHLIVSGDDCDNVASRYGLTRARFIDMNPSVSQDCSVGFWSGYAYCVRLGAPVSITSGSQSASITSSASESSSSSSTSWFNSTYSIQHPTTSWSIITPTSVNSTWPPTQTQEGQPSFCNYWHLVREGEDCHRIILKYSAVNFMRPIDFYAWNPAVGDDCSGLYVRHWVCVGITRPTEPEIELAFNDTELFPTVSLPAYDIPTATPFPEIDQNWEPSPIHGTPASNCKYWFQVKANDTCAVILGEGGITSAQFFAWNPVLNNNCDNLWADYYYCIGAYDPGEEPDMPQAETVQPSPVASGVVSNCVAWYQPIEGLNCTAWPVLFGTFSLAEFLAWNPSITGVTGEDCDNFSTDYWYCVAVPGTPTTRTAPIDPTNPWGTTSTAEPTTTSSSVTVSITTTITTTSGSTTTSSSASSTTSEAAVSTPQPIQAPMISGCRRFYYVQPGDGCWDISNSAGISLADFYLYNPAAAPDCTAMWSQIYVCVGISGPVATFSGTPPIPAPAS